MERKWGKWDISLFRAVCAVLMLFPIEIIRNDEEEQLPIQLRADLKVHRVGLEARIVNDGLCIPALILRIDPDNLVRLASSDDHPSSAFTLLLVRVACETEESRI